MRKTSWGQSGRRAPMRGGPGVSHPWRHRAGGRPGGRCAFRAWQGGDACLPLPPGRSLFAQHFPGAGMSSAVRTAPCSSATAPPFHSCGEGGSKG